MAKIEDIRHSLAHLLATATLKKFPKTKLGIGPVIENGFYYDFLLPHPITPDDINDLEKSIKELIKMNLSFSGKKVGSTEAKKIFKNQPFKLDLIKDFVKESKTLTIYKILRQSSGPSAGEEIFTDLCRGGHIENTSEIDVDSFKLDKISGAYWKGDQKNQQLTRIYGLAFETKQELEKYLAMRAEAEKRDHKKLGAEMDLFVFSDLVGSGLPLFTPHGTIIREELENFVQSLQTPMGYERVRIPHITKRALYEISGHWEKFKEDLFVIKTREGHEFAMKPMNCPHHTQIYASRKRSYRELPIRYSEVTAVYRDEQSGELSGLSRVRVITQDDAHVFCRMNQIEEEAFKVWDIVDKFYAPFEMPLTVRFSRHDPEKMENYLGTSAIWKNAEEQLLKLIKKRGVEFIDGLGEAAMYGPKIDFIAKDSLGRDWQLATIQLDFNLPERFDLTCVNEKGKPERIVMIHRAVLGSVERFMAILIEHFAGNFPLWLSPIQVRVIPISEKQEKYAKKLLNELKNQNIRADMAPNEALGKNIRSAELEKIPYVAVVGDKEIENKTISVKKRHEKNNVNISLENLIQKLKSEIEEKK